MRGWPFVVVACLVGACSGYDPNSGVIIKTTDGGDDAGSGGGESGAGDDSAVAPPVDPFAGAPAFAAGSAPRASVVSKHLSEVGASPTGKDCFASGCHGGSGDAPSLVFGGTVYTDSSAKAPAVGVEVRVVDANSKAYSVYSDTNGNFYQLGTGSLAFPSHPGVRTAANSLAMVNDSTDRSCNKSGCHDGTTQAPVYAP